MALTRAQMRTRVLRNADAVSAIRWDTTAGSLGEVDQKIGVVFDREWKRILNHNRFYKFAQRTPTANTNGRYLISDLTTGSGDTQQRLYRVLLVVIDGRPYKSTNFLMYPIAEASNVALYVYWREGDFIMALPKQVSKVLSGFDGIWVNYIPTRFDNLSGDGVNVDFPDGHEDVLCWESAAFLLSKGGQETAEARECKALAEELRRDMLDDISRFTTDPIYMEYDDLAVDWAG